MHCSKSAAQYILLLFIYLLFCITACQNVVKKVNNSKAPLSVSYTDTTISANEKASILNVIRNLANEKMADSLKFVIQNFQKRNNWVLIQVKPVHFNGSNINYYNTKLYHDSLYKDMIDADLFDNHILVLLENKQNNWHIVEYEFGATDYPGQYWIEQHGLTNSFK